MIRALVADDEALARRSLIAILQGETDVRVVAEAANGLEALERLEEHSPDVVFLDIEMPGLNGFEVIGNSRRSPLVVFVTAYDEYAVRAFEANAIDYLLKPIQPQRVRQALDRVRNNVQSGRSAYAESMKKLINAVRPGVPRKLAARKGKRIVLLGVNEIIRIAIDDKLVFLHTTADRFLTDKSIAELEEDLSASGFFRINRGELVNLECVREIIPWFSGTCKVRLASGAELDVSRERARQLKELIGL